SAEVRPIDTWTSTAIPRLAGSRPAASQPARTAPISPRTSRSADAGITTSSAKRTATPISRGPAIAIDSGGPPARRSRRARAYSSVPSTRSLARPSSRRPPAAASRVRAIAASTVGGLNVGSSIAPNLARDLGSRAELKAALAAVLVKRAEHRAPFAALFDVSFAPRRAEAPRPAGAPATLSPPLPADLTEAAVGEGGSEDLLAALLEALRRN